MKFKKIIFRAVLLLFTLPFLVPAKAQEKDWDRILDRYEHLCNECIDLKIKAQSGMKIKSGQIAPLLTDIREIRIQISQEESSMSNLQKARFERIRRSYTSGSKLASCPSIDSLDTGKIIAGPVKAMETQDGINYKSIIYLHKTVPSPPRQKKIDFVVSYCMGIVPNLSYGASLALSDHRTHWGGYVRFRSNFISSGSEYSCLSDGSASSGTIWTSGRDRISITRISVGGRKVFGKYFGLYLGTGWSRQTTLWEDISGKWAKVMDWSQDGVLLEGGAILDIGPVEIHAGVSGTAFRFTEMEIGIGILF